MTLWHCGTVTRMSSYSWSEVQERLGEVCFSTTSQILAKQAAAWESEYQMVLNLVDDRIKEYPRLGTLKKAMQVDDLKYVLSKVRNVCLLLTKARIDKERNEETKTALQEELDKCKSAYKMLLNEAFLVEFDQKEKIKNDKAHLDKENERKYQESLMEDVHRLLLTRCSKVDPRVMSCSLQIRCFSGTV